MQGLSGGMPPKIADSECGEQPQSKARKDTNDPGHVMVVDSGLGLYQKSKPAAPLPSLDLSPSKAMMKHREDSLMSLDFIDYIIVYYTLLYYIFYYSVLL